jgi:hypothetical protein
MAWTTCARDIARHIVASLQQDALRSRPAGYSFGLSAVKRTLDAGSATKRIMPGSGSGAPESPIGLRISATIVCAAATRSRSRPARATVISTTGASQRRL